MKLVRYQGPFAPRLGFYHERWVIDYQEAHRARLGSRQTSEGESGLPVDMVSLLRGGETALEVARQAYDYVLERLPAEETRLAEQGILQEARQVTFLPPVGQPGKILCVGLNYPPGPGSPKTPPPAYPPFFLKPATALAGHRQPILIPRISRQIEYEGELVIVIGAPGKNIPRAEAFKAVAGYSIANDLGARDVQQRTSQWAGGKIFDTFCPLGPAVVTKDGVPDPNALHIQTRVNGRVVQDANTAEMIFDAGYLVSYLSELVTLEPGDLILTGSPRRAGEEPDPRLFLEPGDRVQVEIERLGSLENKVEEA